MDDNANYCAYFDVDEAYFPCIDESAINAGAKWEATYPHETFIKLLETAEYMLAGSTRRSLWIHGAYGTGKSQCAYALKKILEVPEEELKAYWERYEQLKKNKALLNKLLGHKKRGILTAWRYASGSILTLQQFYTAVQESISKALDEYGASYKGADTLKYSVINWLSDETHAEFVDNLLKKPKWSSTFAQATSEQIIASLSVNGDVSGLLGNIFALAVQEGITALNLTADSLREWIIDVIRGNNDLKIVLIWDEFSDFFKLHMNSLGEFQKIISICQEAPFYFVVVTHPVTSLASGNDSWKIVQQRFDRVEITLPDNIAFELTAHAFGVKHESLKEWNLIVNDLDGSLPNSSSAVMKAANISDTSVIRNILPLHPMTALILKNIASAFQSNQRSMFEFIKTPADLNVKAFQWFIMNTGPYDQRPLLTVDMLWDFFYVKGKDYLTPEIRLVLDVYTQHEKDLNGAEEAVLKTILIMQAVYQRLSGTVSAFEPTDQNLSYAFEGDSQRFANSCRVVAQSLVDRGILIKTLDNRKMYSAAVLAGDSAKISVYRHEIESAATTAKLLSEIDGGFVNVLNLTPALKLRYEIQTVTSDNFRRSIDMIRGRNLSGWKFYAVLAVAKDENEAQSLRKMIRDSLSDDSLKNIVIIDALNSTLGSDDFGKYLDLSAMSKYYEGSDRNASRDYAKDAQNVLEGSWGKRIHDGQFTVYTHSNIYGEKVTGAENLCVHLRDLVFGRFKYVQDFMRGITQPQLTPSNLKQCARIGIGNGDIKVQGIIAGCERNVLSKVWGHKEYLEDMSLSGEPVVIISKAVNKLIRERFDSSGSIAVSEIYNCLENNFGFSPCNLSAFITGFILSEYSAEKYRSMNTEEHTEPMSAEKLAEMLSNYISETKRIDSYIVELTKEEQEFNRTASFIWNVPQDSLTSPILTSSAIQTRMQTFKYPLWCLEYEDSSETYALLKKFSDFVRSSGNAMNIISEIGKTALNSPSVVRSLKDLLTPERFRNGMKKFLSKFEGGKLLSLADETGAGEEAVLEDIERVFSVEYSGQWDKETGENEIRRLISEYESVSAANNILGVQTRSPSEALTAWRECVKASDCPSDEASKKYPALKDFISVLKNIADHKDIRPDDMKNFLAVIRSHEDEIKEMLQDFSTGKLFNETFETCFEDLDDDERREIKEAITENLFTKTFSQAKIIVSQSVLNFRKNQNRSKLFSFWREKTNGTHNPREWSKVHATPLLCCVDPDVYSEAKRVFDAMNANNIGNDADEAVRFLEELDAENFFVNIADKDFRDKKFLSEIAGENSQVLTDAEMIRSVCTRTGIDAYDWKDNPRVRAEVKALADSEYKKGNIMKALRIIDEMNETDLKNMLRTLVEEDASLGMKIITGIKG